jgi:hypothetical protein
MATESDIEETSPPLQVVARLGPPSPRGVARVLAIVAACAGALYLLYLTRGVVKLFVIAVFTATALAPVVDAVQRTRRPRAWAIIVVYLACALAIGGSERWSFRVPEPRSADSRMTPSTRSASSAAMRRSGATTIATTSPRKLRRSCGISRTVSAKRSDRCAT